jgi:hypothetical protein
MKHEYIYSLDNNIDGQVTSPFYITIENGSDFYCHWITGKAYSYEADGGDATDFPIPNSLGVTNWAGRGLSVQITDSRTGRKLTSGYVPFECLFAPGYGMNFQHPMPFKYLFQRNSTIQFDIRNRDNADRNHEFSIMLKGYKIYTPS